MKTDGGGKLRVAVVGVGHLGQHHARVLASIPGCELVGVADTRPEQARAVAARHGTVAFDDFRDLLDQVDAVSVAVPTVLHREVAGYFLARGIATLVEKPLAASVEDAEALVNLARATGAVLQVGHIERFNPALSALERMPMRPRYITAERLSTYTFRSTDVGVVLDLMIHDIDLLLSFISAPVRSVQAVGVGVFGGHEDIANARIEFEDGCVANLTASRASYQALRKMRLFGAEGYASLDFATRQGTLIRPSDQLRRGELDLEGLDLAQPAAIKDRVFGKILRVDHVQSEGREPLALELEDFVQAARGLGRPKVSGEDALAAMRLADQVLQSLQSHDWAESAAGSLGAADPGHALRGPLTWRLQANRSRFTAPNG
ncbi:MAG: Gfo/Idh/MocA family oxidoreductase [Isosphaeraceae bacterium]